jgi:hypothetical protein
MHKGEADGCCDEHEHEAGRDRDRLSRPLATSPVVLTLFDPGGGKQVDGAHLDLDS